MGLNTLNTILNTAPLIIQGATKLVSMLKHREEKNETEPYDIPANLDGMKIEIERLHKRLDTHSQSDLEQVKLIEELAKQNEAIATSLRSTVKQLNFFSLLAIIALVLSIISLAWLVIYHV